MKRLIITNSESGSGCLKQTNIAERVYCASYELVWGPIATVDEPLAFFNARRDLLSDDAEDWELERLADLRYALEDLVRVANNFDRIEIWSDPTTNEQLILAQLIDWLSGQPQLCSKLFVVEIGCRIGEQTPEDVIALSPNFNLVDPAMAALATRVWRAYRQPTPEAVFALLSAEMTRLPNIQKSLKQVLRELPEVCTGLMHTQTLILDGIRTGLNTPAEILHQPWVPSERTIFDYWRLGKLLVDLGQGDEPLILGMPQVGFGLRLHDDAAMMRSFRNSELRLSPLAQRLLDGVDDYARNRLINRWWGGTHLTNDRLWRWDSEGELLVAPIDH